MIVQINDINSHQLALTLLAFLGGTMLGYTICLAVSLFDKRH
jgi:hypothetical protein